MLKKIKSLKIQIGKKEIELSVAEAKQLYDELSEMFEKQIVTVPYYVPRTPYWWDWTYQRPVWYSGGSTMELSGTTLSINCSSEG